MTGWARPLRLVGDLGGTNARAALSADGELDLAKVIEAEASSEAQARAVFHHCMREASTGGPLDAAFAAAGLVEGDRVKLTNGGWSFSVAETKNALGLSRLVVVNDFVGVALGVPYLAEGDRRTVGGGVAKGGPIAVVGAGTGLGVASLIPTAAGAVVVPGEGGHATMSSNNGFEADVLEFLRDDGRRGDGERWGDHVSAERVLSGPGLVNLCRAVHALANASSPAREPHEVTALAERGDKFGIRTMEAFCSMLGTFAGNLALTLGATGGVYLGGGIVPRFADFFATSGFRSSFERKGRFEPYLREIPTFLITHRHPALLGLARMSGLASGPMAQQPTLATGIEA
ncbi:glucokinase [Bradyrhizobium japonicum]|uniref:Glucokinase n=1 Tax=Bradyrhizobium japonicum TaxID=375 RepID=A0ABV2RWQ9_BRAJP|nr:glucokinase [Bradyrhizobium japonicum]WLB16187.1 glucokinase [Bradyrhizobium japonicum]